MENKNKIKELSTVFIQRYLIQGLSGMAQGLFCTLLIGLILKQIGSFMPNFWLGNFLIQIGQLASVMTGVGIAIGTAHHLGAPKLVLYASALNGLMGAYAMNLLKGSLITETGILLAGPGDPMGAFLAAVIGLEVGRRVAGKTKLDIMVTPAVTIIAGGLTAVVLGPPISAFMGMLGSFIETATILRPFLMGIVISVLMGMFLTLPISSAAIAIMLGLSGLAAGAATAGCAAQMIGFAVISYRENKVNGLLAQGLGTSMLQIPNIVKNPRIWIPPIVASAVTGPLATVVFKMENIPAGAGMGTSGLVGPIMTLQTMLGSGSPVYVWGSMILIQFVLPALIALGVAEFLRRIEWIKPDDLKLEL
ncbi:MAG: PTS transporter subunit IIC [Cellulosilyticaceae bacterium]